MDIKLAPQDCRMFMGDTKSLSLDTSISTLKVDIDEGKIKQDVVMVWKSNKKKKESANELF